jgi:hypothetical protein
MGEMTGRRLLLVDQGERHAKHHVVRRLAELGYRLTLLQWSSAVWERGLFDRVLVARFTHWSFLAEALRREHDREPFAGVLCYNEGAVPTANEIAHLLGLPAVSDFAAESFRYKDRMRVAWEAAGLPVPRYRVLHGPADARVLQTWPFPLVIKPAALMGSKGVSRADEPAAVGRLLREALGTDLDIPLEGELWTLSEAFNIPALALAEEYVPGPEYSAEGYVVGGEFTLLGVTGKLVTEEPYFDEVGHVFPTADLSAGQLAAVTATLQRAHAALGMRHGMTHTEFKLTGDGLVLMELNARMAGDFIPLLVDTVLGVDTVALAAACAEGSVPPELRPDLAARPARDRPAAAAVAFLTSPAQGYGRRLVRVGRPVPGVDGTVLGCELYLRPGDVIPHPVGSGTSRLGHVLVTAPDPAAARRAVERIRREVDVVHRADDTQED